MFRLLIICLSLFPFVIYSQLGNKPARLQGPSEIIKIKAQSPTEIPLNFTYNFTNYNVQDGLSQSMTYCVFIDSREILWIGTYGGGLNRFDGEEFTQFTKKDGLADNVIWDILEDDDGNLWMASDNGLIKYNGRTFEQILNEDDLGSPVIRSMHFAKDGTLWLGTATNGVYQYDIKTDEILKHLSPEFLGGERFTHVWAICDDLEGNIWISINRQGVIKYDGDSTRIYTTEKNELGHNLVLDLFCDSDGNVWIASGIGLTKITGDSLKIFTTDDGLVHNWTASIFQAENGDMYFGSHEKGVTVYNARRGFFKTFTVDQGLAGNNVSGICEDANGNIWFSTLSDGISKYEGDTFMQFYPDITDESARVNTIFEDTDGSFWFGTYAGLLHLKDDKLFQYSTVHGLSDNSVYDIKQDENEDLWIATANGLNRFDGAYFYQYFRKGTVGISHNTINSLEIDKSGTIWLATEWGLSSIENGEIAWYFEEQGLSYYLTKKVFEDSKGNIWIGTYGAGITFKSFSKNRTDTSQFIILTSDRGFIGNNNTPVITEDRAGNIWIASFGERIDIIKHNWQEIEDTSDWFVTLDYEKGLINASVEYMLEDDRGDMWIGTVNGVDKVSKADQAVKSGKFNITHVGYYDGYKGVESNRNACLKDSKGYLWFSAGNLVTKYNPDLQSRNQSDPATSIIGVRLFFDDVDWMQEKNIELSGLTNWTFLPENLVLPYNKNHLSFDFIGISHTMSKNVRYKWKLVNFDEDWSPPTDKHETVYANIPPGEYEFQVLAMNSQGKWNEKPAVFHFVILAPYWQTLWFKLSVGFLILLAFIGVFKWRTGALRKRQRILERTVDERTSEVIAQKELVEEQHKEITDSITYAKRIQNAILPSDEQLNTALKDCFVYYNPKDIVAGDFYWLEDLGNLIIFAAADCTGHGVPGAMVSVICHNSLNRAVREFGLKTPDKILNKTRELVIETLAKRDKDVKDGMDIGLCVYDKKSMSFNFSGANNGLYLVRGNELIETKADKQPIGKYAVEKPFTNQRISVQKGDVIYLYTDGYPDQFGGDKGKKFKSKNFKNLLLDIHQKKMSQQKSELHSKFENWRGGLEQVDDVCVIGVRI